jgi:Ca-activated chloride channel family protein
MKSKLWIGLLTVLSAARADVGVILPGDKPEPDPAILALDELAIQVVIVNGHAKVNVRQVFQNRTGGVMEGAYMFTLPTRAAISDFAVWDDVTRIPGVILERKRAEELYEEIRAQAIDPGLLQQGERGEDEARRSAVFMAKVVPIPGFGNKRLETEYQERLQVENLQGYFSIPLRPAVYKAQSAARFSVSIEFRTHHKLKDWQLTSKLYPLQISERTPNRVVAKYEGRNVVLNEDFTLQYTLDASKGDALEVAAYKEGPAEPGFFEAQALLAMPAKEPSSASQPRTVIALFDASLSMQWEKLERSYQALETLLRRLTPRDKFNLLVFNEAIAPYASAGPVEATPEQVDKALAFVKAGRLRGGTNLQAALEAGLQQSSAANDTYLVLLGDGGATRGTVHSGKLAESFAAKWKASASKPRVYVFGVGDDANLPLLKMLARNNGVFEWVRSSEPIDFKLNSFLSKIGVRPVDGLRLTTSVPVDMVYPLQDSAFPGSNPSWVGQYKNAANRAEFSIAGTREGKNVSARATLNLPGQNTTDSYLPRAWAKARVDALLDKIEREGEDSASIDEIIRLSRKYKFVTPYTSFLAAPRALLRPRLIRPGDPVLRIKTDPTIRSVVAVFPFGLVKQLRYLDKEETWQTRFLAPQDMQDGTYKVQLLLKDKTGHVYKESKSFVIASKTPVVRVRLDKARYRPGEQMRMQVSASASTRTIAARMQGAAPVFLRWSADDKSNTGVMLIPSHLPAGKYALTVTAEDFAHNIGSQEVTLEVVP